MDGVQILAVKPRLLERGVRELELRSRASGQHRGPNRIPASKFLMPSGALSE